MAKTVKFTVSMSAAEFKRLESLRRRAGRTRSQFVRDAIASRRPGLSGHPSVREDQSDYGAPEAGATGLTDKTELAERRRRAIAAAGKSRSKISDLSVNHDKYLEEAYAQRSRIKSKRRARPSR